MGASLIVIIVMLMLVYSVKNFIDTVFEPDGSYPKWRGKRSPLQRLAYAYHNRNWEQVKLCAYQLAYDDVVRKRLNEYFAYIKGKITEIDGMLDALENEANAELDDKFPEIRPDPDDFNLN